MILIWDNGRAYSDHAIYFVDCGELTPDDVVSFARLTYDGEAHEIARCDTLEWRSKGALANPTDLAHAAYVLFDDDHDDDVSGITTPALEYLINAFPSVSIRLHEEHARRTV